MSGLLRSYFDKLHDPLVGRAAGFHGEKAAEEMLWLRTFMGLEACVAICILPVSSLTRAVQRLPAARVLHWRVLPHQKCVPLLIAPFPVH